MISLRSSSSKPLPWVLALLFMVVSCQANRVVEGGKAARQQKPSVAIFPVENLSGTPVPLKMIRESLVRELERRNVTIVSEAELEQFFVRHRLRYTAGLDDSTASALSQEVGADGALLTSVELYDESTPPKIALMSRLISTGPTPTVAWMDGAGLAGDDKPGLLGLGLIQDQTALLQKAVMTLGESFEKWSTKSVAWETGKRERTLYSPKIAYRSTELTNKKHKVAIVPFFNKSRRKNAGDILLLQFAESLSRVPEIEVVEPGRVRAAFLNLRIVMDEGVSISEASSLFGVLGADILLTGKVFDYEDYQGAYGKPRVSFSVQLIDRKGRRIVWSSTSHNEGDDGVYFFDVGRINTAHGLAEKMTRSVVEMVEK
jgi:TolB-like protein